MGDRTLSMEENVHGYKEPTFEGTGMEVGATPMEGGRGPSMKGTGRGEEDHPWRGKDRETGNPSLREQSKGDRGPSIEEEEQEGQCHAPSMEGALSPLPVVGNGK